jgi:outer membrane protein, multidrug efflux system
MERSDAGLAKGYPIEHQTFRIQQLDMPRPQRRISSHALLLLPLMLLSGCTSGLITTLGPDYHQPETQAAKSWQTSQAEAPEVMPADLRDWWKQFDDPELFRFLTAAQRVSASVSDARARIQDARAGLVTAVAQGLPRIDSQVDMLRARTTFGTPPFEWTRYQAGLQANWEIDLFGGIARQREAAEEQLAARHSAWHDARVALAVEVANAYVEFRYCQALIQIAEKDAASRRQSAHLVEVAGKAGLRPPSDVALAHASHAESEEGLYRQIGLCERSIKGLVALTGLTEPEVRYRLTVKPDQIAQLPTPPPFRLEGLPATTLLQRPDVAAAEEQVAEASARIGVEEAKRYPKLSLTGNITPQLQSVNGMTAMAPYAAGASAASTYFANTWSFGPTLTLPIFDSGRRSADVEAARIQFEAAKTRFQSTVRTAVKEVEIALVRLKTSEERLPSAQSALAGYEKNLRATDHLYRAGFGNLLELEQARRQTLLARRTLADLQQERVSAWIALYRAAGGGWQDPEGHAPTIPLYEDPTYPVIGTPIKDTSS